MQQRMLIGGLAIITIVLLVFVLFIFNEPNYTVLYTKLSTEDAGKVIEHLNAQKIPYKIEDNEQTIKVPKEKVYEARLQLATKGIPSTGTIGYEIFDKNTMGMSDFMQKLNYKRAIEGELSRTIMQQSGIENARVQVVFPARSVFKDEQKDPTASVVLKLASSTVLTQNNIQGISHLIASSVEGLKPDKVTIVDTKGNLLSRQNDYGPFGNFTGKQYELKSAVENYLAGKAQSILDNVLGYGNSVVKVNAEIDFNQVEKTMELYDPETQVAISEQTVKSESGGKSISDSNVVITQNQTTNYEVSKTIQKVIEGVGNVKRMTLAAVINGIPKQGKDEQGNPKTIMEPRSDEQMKKLENIISQSVGINPQRNDQVSVVSMAFETQNGIETEESGFMTMKFDQMSNLIVGLFGIIAALFILKGLLKRLKNEKIVIGRMGSVGDMASMAFAGAGIGMGGGALPQGGNGSMAGLESPKQSRALIEVGDIEDEVSNDALERKAMHDKIVNYVQKNPVEAAKLINLWLREDDFEGA
ncbi:MAG: flagellar M-ring protein FliF [Ignavibacteriales bacterium]|nr:flagellar M-ring protein FliF [Ignavibacteriales bacterium]